MNSTAFVLGLSTLVLVSCNGMNSPQIKYDFGMNNLENDVEWIAKLSPVNQEVTGSTGEVSIKVQGDNLMAEIQTSGLDEVSHLQSIRSGSCPTTEAEITDESLVFAVEPMSSDATGNYLHTETLNKSSLSDQNLNGKIVVIQGTSENSNLPVLCGSLTEKIEQTPGPNPTPAPPTPGQQQQQQQTKVQ